MKLIAALFVSLPLAAAAVDTPLAFPEAKIEAPPLSLLENSLQGSPRLPDMFPRAARPAPARTVVDPRMPIVSWAGEIDPGMVKAPDSSVDYKLIVVPVDSVPVK